MATSPPEGLKRAASPLRDGEPDPKKAKPDSEPPPAAFVLYKELVGHTAAVSVVRYSPDGKWIASACMRN